MLIGTAGHIDHGKTTLIRALTGVDTDRLPEEKRRGISIDLGYAYLPAPDGSMLGFIDVPGHERFVPTMLAGATGIDSALLVVAADDGPMPQTREHLDILRLLGVGRMLVALTKIDRATGEQRYAAESAISALLAGTDFAEAPVFPVAAPTGEGVAALRDALFSLAAETVGQGDSPFFRLAIDRSFTIPGAGTVVTGTVHAGRISVGDEVELLGRPEQRPLRVRVRSLHANHRAADHAGRGARCALNVVGISHDQAERGDWVVSTGWADTSSRVDVELAALPGTAKLLRPGVDLHVHHGARHLMGRLVPLDEVMGAWQLVTSVPVAAGHGDRLVLRDASGRHTLAGARVLDPAAPRRHRRAPGRLGQLAALRLDDPGSRFAALVDASPAGVDLARFARTNNTVVVAPPGTTGIPGSRHVFADRHLDELSARVVSMLAGYHERHPDESGLERDRLRRFAAPQVDRAVFPPLLAYWLGTGLLARSGALWHLPSHRVELTATESMLAARALPWLLETPHDPPWVRDIAARLGVDEPVARVLMKKIAGQGDVFQIVRDLFFHRDTVGDLASIVREIAVTTPAIKAATLRDRIGGGRKRAIQILEFFDRTGYTRKVGHGQQQAHTIRGEPPVQKDHA
jgi:selenocysteine-specific elongation factor